ncbi:MAG: hypothetical protein IPJ03_16675 [Ignavibacteriales bacterium]|nr:hypothetical protein [Ignavibacteriales bacterium]
MKYKLIGCNKTGAKITLSIGANSPEEAIEKASLGYPSYDFFTTESGEFSTATLITLLNSMSLKSGSER